MKEEKEEEEEDDFEEETDYILHIVVLWYLVSFFLFSLHKQIKHLVGLALL